ncbi:surface-adhesin E family protein [Paraburkholderia sp. BCC1876]|uniref:surface-adhesin E family protein n=1 Tax=Paraburkholderia sp. BCC1876 TaxID=2676303 RepID=UPI00159037E0|nr:surface-adhesin E family protein [Paraburkholderia sp. BCC1876]
MKKIITASVASFAAGAAFVGAINLTRPVQNAQAANAVAASTPAVAAKHAEAESDATWSLIKKTPSGVTLYVTKPVAADFGVTVWLKMTRDDNAPIDGKPVSKVVSSAIIGCSTGQIRMGEILTYDPSGAISSDVKLLGNDSRWVDVQPGSIEESVIRFVCLPKDSQGAAQ